VAENPRADAGREVEVLWRWERSGAVWRVLGRSAESLSVGLFTCDGGELVDRLSTSDPAVLEYVGDRESSEDDL
jgi:hypothetical protein